MGRLLVKALERSGHEVEIVSHLRAWEGRGNAARQEEIRQAGHAEAERLIVRWRARPEERPDAWFTYHLYHKAPDWIGPPVADALGIPYLVTEASHAPKQAGGPWDPGYRAVEAALLRADAVIGLNPVDLEMLRTLPGLGGRLHLLRPFLDEAPLLRDVAAVDPVAVARRYGLRDDAPRLLAVGMMRRDAKLESYRLLARAMARLKEERWQLVLVGDGPAEAAVRAAFSAVARDRVVFAGLLESHDLHALMTVCDLFLWPAVNEAFGMAILEAQACGLPVVAGRSGGVGTIVADGKTGLLAVQGDEAAFARAVSMLLTDGCRRAAMAEAAIEKVRQNHGIATAARGLGDILQEAARGEAGRRRRGRRHPKRGTDRFFPGK